MSRRARATWTTCGHEPLRALVSVLSYAGRASAYVVEIFEMRVYVRVAMDADGKTPVRELMVDGLKVAELSYIDAITFAMQIVSSLRFEPGRK